MNAKDTAQFRFASSDLGRRRHLAGLLLGPVLVGLAACGGGGGGGGNGPVTPGTFETAEYYRSGGLGQIRASHAYAAGNTGAGVTVAVMGAVDSTHPELDSRLAGSFKVRDGNVRREACSGPNGCFTGTPWAGLIAAERDRFGIHGAAYGSKVLAVDSWASTDDPLAISLAAGLLPEFPNVEADIIHDPFNGSQTVDTLGPEYIEALEAVSSAGKLVVLSAGDKGQPLPPESILNEPGIGRSMIAVGAVDQNNEISSMPGLPSNVAGEAQDRFVVAPGEDIETTLHRIYETCAPFVGCFTVEQFIVEWEVDTTRSSAAFAAGAAALLKEAFPHLSGSDIADILLTTAADLGDPGVDAIYGHGLINLAGAFDPVGTLSMPMAATVDGKAAPLAATSLDLGPAFGDALSESPLLDQAIALDAFDRPYRVNLSAKVARRPTTLDLAPLVVAAETRSMAVPMPMGALLRMSFSDPALNSYEHEPLRADLRSEHAGTEQPEAVNLSMPLGSEGSLLRLGVGIAPQALFPFVGSDSAGVGGAGLFYSEAATRMPHFAIAGHGSGGAYRHQLSNDAQLVLGWFEGDDAVDNSVSTRVRQALIRHRMSERVALGLGVGHLQEEGSFLGSRSTGAFGESTSSGLSVVSLLGSYALTDDLALVGSYSWARAEIDSQSDSLLSDVGTVHADAASLGLIQRGLLTDGDRGGVLLSQPLRVSEARAKLAVPVGRDLSGNVIYRSESVDLVPSGREIDLEFAYERPIAAISSLGTHLLVRHEPGHEAGADWDLGLALRTRFPL